MDPYLHTFGRTELIAADPPPPGLTSGRPLLLLAYLVLNQGKVFERAYLVDLLWGDDHDEAAGRRAFRQALYVVRKALPPGSIEADERHVRLVKEVASDAREMDAALEAGDGARIADLYEGPFLPEVTADASLAFQHWADERRTYYRRHAREVLLRSADEAVAEPDPEAAVQLLSAADEVDGFDLGSELRAVRLWLSLGRSAKAADVARRALDRSAQLDLSLPEDVRSRLEATADGPSPAQAGTAPPRFPVSPQLTGRARERTELLAAWRRAAKGEGVTVLVLGDPGVGKSRLINEVMAQASAEGAMVLEGRSYALESRLLYGSLIEVLRQSLEAPGFAGVGDVWLAELSRLLPELREKYPALNPPGPEGPEGRRRFYESVAQVFEAIAYEQPVCCVLDDLHWADEATLELLHYLGRRLCARPVLFVAGIRPGESSEALRKLQDTLVRERAGVVIELEPLAEAETRDLVSSMFGHRPLPEEFPALVWTSSEGNPFFAVSMVEALSERGCVSVTSDQEVVWDETGAKGVPKTPRRVEELIRARLSLLSGREASLLDAAAVAGRSFAIHLLAAVTGLELDEVGTDLASMERRRLIRSMKSDDRTRWAFTHDRIREVVYEGLEGGKRSTLHAAVARAQVMVEPNTEPASSALHAVLAGDRRSAFRHSLEAGRWACSVFAFNGARELLQVALANAPDAAARALVEAELDALPEARAPDGRLTAHRRMRRLAWGAAAVLVAAVALTLVEIPGHRARAVAQPRSPAGILVRVEQGDSSYLGVFHADHPAAPIQRLPAHTLAGFTPASIDKALLSPNGRWVAKAIALPGGSPDVYAIRADGSDTVRLTNSPEDDVSKAWFPDSRKLLIQAGVASGTAQFAYHLFTVSLSGGPPQPVVPDALRGTWWFASGAAVSPDGTEIAAVVRGDRGGLWLMDTDGANAKRLMSFDGAGGSPAFSPDGTRVAFFETSMRHIDIVGVHSAFRARVGLTWPGADSRIFWTRDGQRILFSANVDGDDEVFAVDRDGSELHRMTYSNASEVLAAQLGENPRFVDQVDIIASSDATKGILVGDSVPVSAVARDPTGAVLRNVSVPLRCALSAICRVHDGWLHAEAAGSTSLIANAGGWRADTLKVSVLDATPVLELSESWDHGIDSAIWQEFGYPAPIVLPHAGRGGSAGFQANGDKQWKSGVITRRQFSTRRGLTLDFWARGVFNTPWPSWQWMGAGVTGDSLVDFTGTGPFPKIAASVVVMTTLPGRPVSMSVLDQSMPAAPIIGDLAAWHRFTLQLLPQGQGELWVDGHLAVRAYTDGQLPPEVRVALFGRATKGPVIQDDVKIYEGILLRK